MLLIDHDLFVGRKSSKRSCLQRLLRSIFSICRQVVMDILLSEFGQNSGFTVKVRYTRPLLARIATFMSRPSHPAKHPVVTESIVLRDMNVAVHPWRSAGSKKRTDNHELSSQAVSGRNDTMSHHPV